MKTWFRSGLAAAIIAMACLPAMAVETNSAEKSPSTKSPAFKVHEWGTFTALQDEKGHALTGINVDDEPVPGFVHNLNPFVLASPFSSSLHWQYRQKGTPSRHPQVAMRLETPVIYFHPTRELKEPITVDVDVTFRGGWLTEFYPAAEAKADGLDTKTFRFSNLTAATVGGLSWKNLKVGVEPKGPETSDHVWLAPRRVKAAGIENAGGEREHYLFYRGVGNINAPMTALTDRQSKSLTLVSHLAEANSPGSPATAATFPSPAWLLSVQPDGSAAYRAIPLTANAKAAGGELASMSYEFSKEDHTFASVRQLENEMRESLITDGLNEDEAIALLSTWQRAYFQSPGLRIFYLVPQKWTDEVLPLTITGNPPIERVMVGRIELITERQRDLLKKLTQTKVSDGSWVEQIPESPEKHRFLSGRTPIGDLQTTIPEDYQTYLDLGRFRNALVVDSFLRTRDSRLNEFINRYELRPFLPPRKGEENE